MTSTGSGSLPSAVPVKLTNCGQRVIAVASGKGGVGKTSLVVNLAIALSKLDQRVTIFDADLGLANVELLLGLRPPSTLFDVLYRSYSIEEVMTPVTGGVNLISGGSGLAELANLEPAQQKRLFDALSGIKEKTDYLLVDTGAGLTRTVLGFVAAAGEVIVLVTPEPTSMTDAYGLIKVLSKYRVHRRVLLLANRVRGEKEALQVTRRMQVVCERYLDIEVDSIGYIREDTNVGQAVREQVPLAVFKPYSSAFRDISALAGRLVSFDQNARPGKGITYFAKRLFKIFS